jgi:ribosomal protein S18 acetylase RimI-like enzyme
MIGTRAAVTADDYAIARRLFEGYAAWLREDRCFQGFAAELERLPDMYGAPNGVLLLGWRDGEAVGCVGVRRLADDTCEMKRLFVREDARGLGLGWRLAREAVEAGRRLGYARMVLDTLDRMETARRMYAALGFVETSTYYENPLPGVRYMGLELASRA